MIRFLVGALPIAASAAVAVAARDRAAVSTAAMVLGTVYVIAVCVRWEAGRWPSGPSLNPTGGIRRVTPPATVPEEARLTRELSFTFRSRAEYDATLRPALYRAARGRLWELGASVDDPRQVRALLGSEIWSLITPAPRGEVRRDQPPPPASAIERAIERIERT